MAEFKSPGIERDPSLVPLQTKLPDANDMLELEDADLLELLQQYGIVDPWDVIQAREMELAGKLKSIPNPRLFAAQSNRAAKASSGKKLLGISRRTQERYNTISIINGRPDVELIRIPDNYDPDRLCENCESLAGLEGTYQQHMAAGLPGAQSCLGSDYCRCSLMEISDD